VRGGFSNRKGGYNIMCRRSKEKVRETDERPILLREELLDEDRKDKNGGGCDQANTSYSKFCKDLRKRVANYAELVLILRGEGGKI